MSGRISYFFAVLLLLLAALLRLNKIITIPPGLNDDEIVDIRVAETARNGSIEVFYDLGGEGREGLYHFGVVLVTTFVGDGPLGFRLLSVWINLLAIALTYAFTRRLFGQLAGLGAMGLLTVTMWPVLLSRQIMPETMLPFFVAYVLFCLASVLPIYRRRRRRGDSTTTAAALGVLLGFVLYVHPVGLLIVLFSMVFILYMILSKQQRISRRRLGYINFAVLLLIIISMPYLISSIRNPELAGVERLTTQNSPGISVQRIVDSIGGLVVTGDANPLHNLPGRPMFDPVTFVLILVGLGAAIWYWKRSRHILLLTALIVLSPVFLFPQATPNFGNYTAALPILAGFFGLGLALVVKYIPRYGTLIGVLGLTILLAYNVQWLWPDVFHDWPNEPDVRVEFNADLGELALYLDTTATDKAAVLCGWDVTQSPSAASLTDAQLIRLMQHRKDRNLRETDCRSGFIIPDGGESSELIIANPGTLSEVHPEITRWLEQSVQVPIDGAGEVRRLEVADALADRIGVLTVNAPVSYAPEVGGSREELVNTPISFGGNLTFLGYIPEENPQYTADSIVTLVTYWRIDGMVPPDLRFFTHILADPGASPAANMDIINAEPRLLRNRDILVQVTYITLPRNMPAGDYLVSIGAYQDTSDTRLDVLRDGQPYGNRLFLFPITVEAGT